MIIIASCERVRRNELIVNPLEFFRSPLEEMHLKLEFKE